jgi:hypothetical protein
MIAKALRRARTRYGLFISAALLFTAGVFGAVGLTSAIFQARFDTKTATFAGGYVAVPTLTTNTTTVSGTTTTYPVQALGYDGVVRWTPGVQGVQVQQIFGADRGTTSNCTSASYSTTVTNTITSTASVYTDSNRATTPSLINGDWYCYEVISGYPTTTAPVWTATTTAGATQIGLAPTSVVINNGLTGDGTIDKSDTSAGARHNLADTIVITYNQPVVDSGSGTTKTVCSFPTGNAILIGDTTACNASSTIADANTTGKITETTVGGGIKKGAGTIGVSGNQITVTISTNGGTASGTAHYVSSTSGGTVLSSATTDQATACTTGVNCTVLVSGNF